MAFGGLTGHATLHFLFRQTSMKKIFTTLVLILLAWPIMASDANMHTEIEYLIKRIQNSNCAFIRNGKAHSAEEAIEHILKKYDHFKAKIKTTEDFIDYCASKSMLSGKSYQIKCPDQDMVESRLWFLEILKQFRRQYGAGIQ
jgi:hypothetical protein